MAIFHMSISVHSRSHGCRSTEAAAYRSCERILDERTGEIFDYTKKKGLLEKELLLPGGGVINRSDFWNRVELHHKRSDAVVSREVEFSLPRELDGEQRSVLAKKMGQEISERYQVAVDLCLHDERKFINQDGLKCHNSNFHAHGQLTTCTCDQDGTLGKKVNELDPIWCARNQAPSFSDWARKRWAEIANAHLEMCGHEVRISHLSLEDQNLARAPTRHQGPKVASMLRRGWKSNVENRINAELDFKDQELLQLQNEAEIRKILQYLKQGRRQIAELHSEITSLMPAIKVESDFDVFCSLESMLVTDEIENAAVDHAAMENAGRAYESRADEEGESPYSAERSFSRPGRGW